MAPSFRLGITSRLVVGFVGVAALVLGANTLLENDMVVQKTTQITRIETPAPSPGPPAAEPVREVTPIVEESRRSVDSGALSSAIERLGRAVQKRSHSQSPQADDDIASSLATLNEELRNFSSGAGTGSSKTLVKSVAAEVNRYASRAGEVVDAGEKRRDALAAYGTLIQAADADVEQSLARSFKIFGRVVARQSLVRLSADLQGLRQAFGALEGEEQIDPAAMDALARAEQSLIATLESNEKTLRHSEGDSWYEETRRHVLSLAASRELLAQSDLEFSAESSDFEQMSVRLRDLIPRRIESTKRVVRVSLERTPPAAVRPANTAPPASVVKTQTVTDRVPPDESRHRLIVWSSTVIVALLLYVCIGTVVSVVRPVRRLLQATVSIAGGNDSVRVARGGIRELDRLAVAFNTMADELAKARATALDYQQTLEQKVAERTLQLQELAQQDPLTGLPNRRQLFALLSDAINTARAAHHLVAVFFLDIDNFKYINDSLGHAFGDRVLLRIAKRLHEAALPYGCAARFGGDEFTMLFTGAATPEDVRMVGLSLVQAFQAPMEVDGRELIVSASVGASIFPTHGHDAEALLRAADAALFRAKKLGRSQLSVFTPDLLESAACNFTTGQGLRRAIERGEFELLFQPEVHAGSFETSVVEALIRWRTPDGNSLGPGEFLDVAEESGLIVEISDWVLESAVAAAAHWHHGAWPAARVAINVSPRQLFDHQFVERLQALLTRYRVPARCIEVELTESVLQTGPATIAALRGLQAHGVAIALDDFGAGYSSLASVELLPLNRIKLDRSLIAGIDINPRSAAIARAIIGMCQGLGLEITAEGVERPEQFSFLLGQRSLFLQGFLLSPPVPRDDLIGTMARVTARAQDLVLRAPRAGGATVRELAPVRERSRTAKT